MNQNIWGPHLWFSLHTISFTYPLKPKDEDKKNYQDFFTQLQHVIPCSVCKKNYKRHLQEFPVNNHLNSRKDIVYWVIDLHNMVNSETGKRVISYEDALKRYEDVYKKEILLDPKDEDKEKVCESGNCDQDEFKLNIPNHYIYLIIFILLLFIAIYYFHKNFKIKMIPR
jgi:hypothetical protein